MKLISALKSFHTLLYQKALEYKDAIRWLLALTVAIVIILLYQSDAFERFELLTLDYRFLLRQKAPEISNIVFIDMAEDSIDAIGRWPWPRKWHAALVTALAEYKPKAIAFDVIFSEPQDDIDDMAFAEAIKRSGSVYLPLLYDLKNYDLSYLYSGSGVDAKLDPIPVLKKEIKGTGHINALPDLDGVMRRVPALISFRGRPSYQLGMKIALDIRGSAEKDISFDPDKHRILIKDPDGKTAKIPLDNNNQLIVNWHGRWGKEFKHFSYIDVIRSYALIKEGKKPIIDLNEFRDKVCVIGLTASGLIDIKPIPLQTAYPAVGINATVIENIENSDFIYEVPRQVNMFLILFMAILVTLLLSNMRFFSGMAFAGVGMAGYFLFSLGLFQFFGISVATFYPIFAIFISYGLTSIYTQILQTIERIHLFRQATRDGLTGLYNIRHFTLLIEAELKNVSLYKFRHLSVVMFDIDNFKHLNDTYGHQAGDTILREFSKIIQAKCRQIDVVARYGGEEFIVMLSGAAAEDAASVAEKIREAIAERKFRFGADTYSTTISMGVAQYSNEKTKDELIEKADKALYRSKNTGKNRVTIYAPDMAQEKADH